MRSRFLVTLRSTWSAAWHPFPCRILQRSSAETTPPFFPPLTLSRERWQRTALLNTRSRASAANFPNDQSKTKSTHSLFHTSRFSTGCGKGGGKLVKSDGRWIFSEFPLVENNWFSWGSPSQERQKLTKKRVFHRVSFNTRTLVREKNGEFCPFPENFPHFILFHRVRFPENPHPHMRRILSTNREKFSLMFSLFFCGKTRGGKISPCKAFSGFPTFQRGLHLLPLPYLNFSVL